MKKIIVLIVVILILGFFWFKGKDATVSTPVPAEGTLTTTPASPSLGGPAAPATTVKEFTVLGSNFAFTPSTLEVNKGDTVKVIFKNTDGSHSFNIDGFAVATKQLQAGESETVQFVADKTGPFEYYCAVGNHRAMGMKGTLNVTGN